MQYSAQPAMSTLSTSTKSSRHYIEEGACPLRQAFELTSPGVAYDTEKAQRKLLVMPLASIRMGDPFSGPASTLLMEFIPGVNYQNIANILNAVKSPCAKQGFI